MGLFSKFKGKSSQSSDQQQQHQQQQQQEYAPPSGPPPGFSQSQSGPSSGLPNYTQSGFSESSAYPDEKKKAFGGPSTDEIGPPSFPPPHFTAAHPDFSANTEQVSDNNGGPPPGPPPNYTTQQQQQQYLPPGYEPPQNSIFDPLFSHAPDAERDWGDHFTSLYPLYPARLIQPFERAALQQNHFALVAPPPMPFAYDTTHRFKGSVQQPDPSKPAFVRSLKNCPDTTFVSSLPLFSPHMKSEGGPHGSGRLYFEVLITTLQDPHDASIAIGFACLPYPNFRLPGWHRGSVAVHSDDGRRYVNDSLSGKPFVLPFVENQTVGLGINLDRMVVFFTRNGRLEKEWSLISDRNEVVNRGGRGVDPERQYRDGGIEGFEGVHDIYAAVGIFGEAGVVVNFGGSQPFLYRGL
ncbi:hypothetical protein DV495_002431 [Geotrichum candidum]|uniref:B30.2/SPRY domain-containing protein n=1 Tax=Geotrichum candidum TaxID=1173061 RepID=A0A0J9X3R5_GEOCN|nr:hypothetical protein DV454_004484 [Geotrichum candidum]KAI9212147.1 hypothetical protein DS838_002993 [Geotrichum bryndzae]KAF5119677.1 hypothetical protein DV452_001542 [Geotrichum candidum]KAF5129269.1 hypothetical protein DV495_002431 [Geotrichum candidum]KAF7498228.1 hypothetical protein DV113_003725 [Geotrichum candidum]